MGCKLFTLVQILHILTEADGSVTMLSNDLVKVYEGASITLYCHIKPFDHTKCHRWYKELEDGSIHKIAEGSYLFETKEELEVGTLITPEDLPEQHDDVFATPCRILNTTTTTQMDTTTGYSNTSTPIVTNQTTSSITSSTLQAMLSSNPTSTRINKETDEHHKYYPSRHDLYYMLTITRLNRKEDEFKYFCQYYCEECDSRRSELVFTTPATLSSLHLYAEPETNFVDIGEIIKLTCEVTSRPQAVIKWILVLNEVNVPHIENQEPTRLVYDPDSHLYTVTSIFQFKGGNVYKNPMFIYCQVASPVADTAIISNEQLDLVSEQEEISHDHKKRRKRGVGSGYIAHDHSGHANETDSQYADVMSFFDSNFQYDFDAPDSAQHSRSGEHKIHFEYLTTHIYTRKVYRLPTAAFDRRWRAGLIVVSSSILILPVVVGFIQIILRKTEGIHIVHEKQIKDYYKQANSERNSSQVDSEKNMVEEEKP